MVMGSAAGVVGMASSTTTSGTGAGGGGGDQRHNDDTASECRLRGSRRRRRLLVPGGGEEEEVVDGGDDQLQLQLQDDDDVSTATGGGGGEKRARKQQHGHGATNGGGGEEDGPSTAAASATNANASVVVPGPPLPQAAQAVAFGSVSLAGRLRTMEDAVSLYPSLCFWSDGSPIHFFAVFDGHGGSHVAALCRDQMHAVVAAELAVERQQGAGDGYEEERAWRSALSRSFARVDALAARECGRTALPPCPCPRIVGSTAIVALLVRDRLVVANCGDSRAVLTRSRPSLAVPLSSDQKPDRPDEKARIESVGGRVVYANGPRVRGILAMSRAIGHRYLKPEVICDPEISITARTEDDDCLILASDGMWDVISNQTACNVARQCLEDGGSSTTTRSITSHVAAAAGSGSSRGGDPFAAVAVAAAGQQSDPRCYRAAALLARLALGRESSDNISVIVIDLKGRRG